MIQLSENTNATPEMIWSDCEMHSKKYQCMHALTNARTFKHDM